MMSMSEKYISIYFFVLQFLIVLNLFVNKREYASTDYCSLVVFFQNLVHDRQS